MLLSCEPLSIYITHSVPFSYHPVRTPPKKRSPQSLKTLRVCFKSAFKTCHCEGKRQNISFSKHSAPSFLTFLLTGIFSLVLYSSALVRKQLQFSVQPEAGALGFLLTWCLPHNVTASGPPFTFPLFKTTWFSTSPANLLQRRSLPSPCTALAPLLLRPLLVLCSPPPPALLVCLLHPSIYIGKMYVARGMDCSFKICTTPSLVGVR